MNLLVAPIGVVMKIIKIRVEGDQKKQLANMGFLEDADVIMISNNGGNIIINVKDSRVALGKELAQKINVIKK